MTAVSTSRDVLPYTPNNNRVLELIDGPVILSAPDILDRYWSVEIADAYTTNLVYIGSRATDGYGGHHAFVGPHFHGKLPEGVVEHRVNCDTLMLALRIAVDKNNVDEDTKRILDIKSCSS